MTKIQITKMLSCTNLTASQFSIKNSTLLIQIRNSRFLIYLKCQFNSQPDFLKRTKASSIEIENARNRATMAISALHNNHEKRACFWFHENVRATTFPSIYKEMLIWQWNFKKINIFRKVRREEKLHKWIMECNLNTRCQVLSRLGWQSRKEKIWI